MSQDPLDRISDRSISASELQREVERLTGREPPSFWVDRANDRTYPAANRAVFVCQLFERHVNEPVELAELASMLDGATWIDAAQIEPVAHLRGELPVEWNLGETVLAVRLFARELTNAPVLYLRLVPPTTPGTVERALLTRAHDDSAANVRLLEASCGGSGFGSY
jgi:hypothetical protein